MASATQAEQQDATQEPWFLRCSFPVFLPSHVSLTASQADFETYLKTVTKSVSIAKDVQQQDRSKDEKAEAIDTVTDTTFCSDVSAPAEIREELGKMKLGEQYSFDKPVTDNPFIKGLLSHQDAAFQQSIAKQIAETKNLMRTENLDIAYHSTTDPLLDLFTELEDVVSGPRLLELLEGAWKADAEMTLRIIFNARSIHLGKASRQMFYRCAGWLAKNHPQTLLANLAWLSRPVIAKKMEKEKKESDKKEEEFEMVFAKDEGDENDPARFDVRNGVAHGYWKDLLNILALYVNGKLDVLANPRDILNIEQEKDKSSWPKSQEEAQTKRHQKRDSRYETAVKVLQEDPVYRALHLTVTRLFAAQLEQDLAALRGKDAAAKRKISLCAKWAPSSERFHDKHTFVVSSIAEILHPASEFAQFASGQNSSSKEQRQLYLRYAREAYRKDVSGLRKHLEVVEREIAANTYENIKYDRVPSIAMNNYASLFATKDNKRFIDYVDKVAEGKARISGATLLPSKLIKAVRETNWNSDALDALDDDYDEDSDDDEEIYGKKMTIPAKRTKGAAKKLVNTKIAAMKLKVLEGQWKTLVQRIKDSGTLSNSIAVADVSGSMQGPVFPDGTCPMDSSIGLALLVAEVTQPPFGGCFITFSDRPMPQWVDRPGWTLKHKVECALRSGWGMSTNFEAVFSGLILPLAVKHELKQEDMVKRVFVFSDMQFDQATRLGQDNLDSSFERIRKKYHDAGYKMPELVFWNLAGGRARYPEGGTGGGGGDPVAPKPVTAQEGGTAIVSGYSQGMLKVFLEGGSFEDEIVDEDEEENEEGMVEVGKDGEVVVDQAKKKQKLDPLSVMRKAVGHRAYSMLRVLD